MSRPDNIIWFCGDCGTGFRERDGHECLGRVVRSKGLEETIRKIVREELGEDA